MMIGQLDRFRTLVMVGFMVAGLSCGRSGERLNRQFSGTVDYTEYSVGAPAGGRIRKLFIDEGQRVKKGDVLAELERFDQARLDYERVFSLWEAGEASQQAMEFARQNRDDQQVSSPVNGVVLVKVREEGEVVPAGGPVAVLGDQDQVWVKIFVPQGEINRIAVGDAVKIHLDGVRTSFAGKVSYIAPQAEFTPRNVQTREERILQTFAVKVRFDQPPENLHAGVAADVSLEKSLP